MSKKPKVEEGSSSSVTKAKSATKSATKVSLAFYLNNVDVQNAKGRGGEGRGWKRVKKGYGGGGGKENICENKT